MSSALGITDVPRGGRIARTAVRAAGAGVAGAAILAAAWYGLRAPRSTIPDVAADTLVFDTVARGTLVRDVRANGALASNAVRYVSAPGEGEVAALAVRIGQRVAPGATLAVLRSAELEAAIPDVTAQLDAALADQRSAEAASRTAALDGRSASQSLHSQARQAALEARVDAQLNAQGLIGSLAADEAKLKADDLAARARLQDARTLSDAAQQDAKVAAARARVADLRALLAAKRAQLGALTVTVRAPGVVQELPVQVGQRVAPGTVLARLADVADLKAVLLVADNDVRDVAPGDAAVLRAGSAALRGHVLRIAPSASNGSVAVDVALEGTLPAVVRADMTVDGTVEVGRASGVLTLARPANADDDGTIALYKVVEGGRALARVPVRLGRGSLERVRVVSGLAPGDRVVVSDMTPYANAARLRLR
jgi:HlyD family secretion protein